MISATSVVSTAVISALSLSCWSQRKSDLVAVGQWALGAGQSALVSAVTLAIESEGLISA
jgi:hypothetical protein